MKQDITIEQAVAKYETVETDDDGSLSWEAIQGCAAISAARTLRRIEDQLASLGNDGLHTLIREELREVRATRRARLDRFARRRKAKGKR